MVSQLIETYGREVVSRPMQRINRIDTLGSTYYIHFRHYHTRCYLACNQKLARISLIYRTEPTTKKWRTKNRKKLRLKLKSVRIIVG